MLRTGAHANTYGGAYPVPNLHADSHRYARAHAFTNTYLCCANSNTNAATNSEPNASTYSEPYAYLHTSTYADSNSNTVHGRGRHCKGVCQRPGRRLGNVS